MLLKGWQLVIDKDGKYMIDWLNILCVFDVKTSFPGLLNEVSSKGVTTILK